MGSFEIVYIVSLGQAGKEHDAVEYICRTKHVTVLAGIAIFKQLMMNGL